MKKRVVAFLLCLSAVLGLLPGCGAKNTASSMKLVRTEGEVGVLDGDSRDVPLMDSLPLYSGYHVATRTDSFAWIDLDETKLAKMDQESEVAVEQEGRALAVTVSAGSLFFQVTEPLAEDETMEIRVSNVVAGIRGTCGWVDYVSENVVRVSLVEGSVACRRADGDGTEAPMAVNAGEQGEFVIAPDGSVTCQIRPISGLPAFVSAEGPPVQIVGEAQPLDGQSGAPAFSTVVILRGDDTTMPMFGEQYRAVQKSIGSTVNMATRVYEIPGGVTVADGTTVYYACFESWYLSEPTEAECRDKPITVDGWIYCRTDWIPLSDGGALEPVTTEDGTEAYLYKPSRYALGFDRILEGPD